MGWVALGRRHFVDAQQFFDHACGLDPENREYREAQMRLREQMQTGNAGNADANDGCSLCHLCTGLLCLNLCCDTRHCRRRCPMSEPNPPRGSSRGRRRTTYRLAICSVFCALGTVMLGLGALVELIDITCAALAAVLFLPVFYRYGTGYTLLCWAVTSALGLILMPQSLAPWLFACLLGYYPVVKRQVDRLPKPLALLCKLCIIGAALAVYLVLFWLIMMGASGSLTDVLFRGFGEEGTSAALIWVMIGLCILTFFLFDLLIDRMAILYRLKWQKRAEKWMK